MNFTGAGRRRNSIATAVLLLALLASGIMPALAGSSPGDGVEAPDQGVAYELPIQDRGNTSPNAIDFHGEDGSTLQLVIGPDGRVQVTDTTAPPYNKIAHLIIIDQGTGIGQRCTGTFVGSNVLLTAAHCLWNPNFEGFPDSVEVMPGRHGEELPFGTGFAGYIWVPQAWIDSLSDGDTVPDWDFDYGLVVMSDDSLGDSVGTMTIGVLDDAALDAADFNPTTAGYPGDKELGTMWMGTAPAFNDVTATALVHSIDSTSGQSGSAVWSPADELIVGIETYETSAANISRRITSDVIANLNAACSDLDCEINVASEPTPPDDGGNGPPPVDRPSDPAFQQTWARTDRPVADGEATRTWMWGPQANTQVVIESYDQAPGGQRAVQYWDKSRMEITDPTADSNSIWYVTNGLLATELITGRMQLGDNRFEERGPAAVNVAGDANDPSGPTYASFSELVDATGQPVGTPVTQRVNRAGIVVDEQGLVEQGITIGHLDEVTNHGIAGPFWTFMNATGTVYQNGQFTTAPLFENAYFATGRPITEPYWANVLVGGTDRLVLMQCFERRCLTYTPDNAPEWQVEMGNIGQHYFAWRY